MSGRLTFGVAALAAAALLLESSLTRLLAVAQFYHFAFLAVSLALLGFGASGTLLSLAPRLRAAPVGRVLAWTGAGFAASAALAYASVNLLPFDSYSIAWERRQILYFVLYYLALALPFLCAGLGIGAALAASEGHSHRVYAANLLGSAMGVLLAPIALELAGVPGAVLAAGLIGLLPVFATATEKAHRAFVVRKAVFQAVFLAGLLGFAWLTIANYGDRAALGMVISPYKGLAHAWRFPGSTVIFSRWSATSRGDVVANAGTRTLPGLSYTYGNLPPPQHGLSLDADSLQPITLVLPEAFDAAAFLPEALAFDLRPASRALVLEPGGGLGVLQALAGRAGQVTAVVSDPLILRGVALTNPVTPYAHPCVRTVQASVRAHLAADPLRYDIVFLPLTDAYRPIASGAYSLAESYTLTVEAFEAALARLAAGGLLVTTRWLQMPPSEDLRLLATLTEALTRRGVSRPADALVAYRGIQTLTVIVQPDGWREDELARLRQFTEARRYDLVWAPDVRPDEVNRFNRTARPEHFEAARAVLTATDRGAFYATYPFAVAPATDDRPFFFHFFRWGQTSQVLAALGRTWQPFGGSGYLILFALLALVLLLSAGLIVLPLAIRPFGFRKPEGSGRVCFPPGGREVRPFAYFTLLGVAFLFVEIPLIQRSILLFGQPIYAFTVVVLALLLFSSAGSLLARSSRLPRPVVFPALFALALLIALAGPAVNAAILGWPLAARVAVSVVELMPLAILMGLPFPLGLAWLETRAPGLVPWAWAVNGCASVVASVLAAILSLSFGFTAVLLLGAGAYGLAGIMYRYRETLRVSETRRAC